MAKDKIMCLALCKVLKTPPNPPQWGGLFDGALEN